MKTLSFFQFLQGGQAWAFSTRGGLIAKKNFFKNRGGSTWSIQNIKFFLKLKPLTPSSNQKEGMVQSPV